MSPRFALVLAFAAASVHAQVTGTILGTVFDESNSAVPGAEVTATNTLTNEKRQAASDPAGQYILTALPVGLYKVEVRSQGFKAFVATGIQLEVNQNIRLDPHLTIGAVAESVEVTTDAAKVDTYQTQVGAIVDTKRVNELPLNGRNVYDLAITLPGVSNTNFNTVSNSGGAFLNVNGSRTRQSTFMLDGAFNNAGVVNLCKLLHEITLEEFNQCQAVNLAGTFLCMKYQIAAMLAAGRGGSIVNTASAAGVVGFQRSAEYGGSKGGIIAMSRAAAIDYGAQGIRVNSIAPGAVLTPMVQKNIESNPGVAPIDKVRDLGRPDLVSLLELCARSKRQASD